MPAFVIERKKAKKIKQKEFKDEKELHHLIDKNLLEIFGIRYIKDEHITDKHGRIETLGLGESNRPVVIEYKKVKEKGQLIQANRYMTWIKQNPDSFELLARKNLGVNIGEIDFSNPRILCFAQEYTIDDKCLALSLGAELWKYRYYENNTLIILREEEPEQLIKEKGKKHTIQKISRQPRPPKSIEEHLNDSSKELIDTFEELNNRILDISSEIERYTTNAEIIFKTSLVFASFGIQKTKNCIKILFRTIDDKIKDPKNITEKIPKSHGYGNITRILYVYPKDIKSKKYYYDDIIDLMLQSYNTTQ